jgi:hypothetical protein
VHDANEELRLARAEVHRRLPVAEEQKLTPSSPNESISMPNETSLHENSNGVGEGGVDDIMAYHASTISSNSLSNRWEEAKMLVASERNVIHKANRSKKYKLEDGRWPNPLHIWNQSAEHSLGEVSKKPTVEVSSSIIDTDSYAVVTFTSRQAAIAARQCIADGCGLDRWREIDYIPIPPLADAPPWNIFGESGCATNGVHCEIPLLMIYAFQIAVGAADQYLLRYPSNRKDGVGTLSSSLSFFSAYLTPYL